MPRKLTQEEFVAKSNSVHNNKYDYSQVNYINISTPVTIICPVHGPFIQVPRDHYTGHGCPSCGNCKRTSLETFLERAKQVHGDKYDYSRVEYKNNKIPVEIICPEHGSFMQSPEKHTARGQGCPKCKPNYKMTKDDFIEKAKKVHGDLYDYSKVEYVNSSTKVCIIDPNYGEFWQTPNAHLNGEGNSRRKFDRIRETSLEKYGVDNYTKTAEYSKKSKQTCLEKYGVPYSLQSDAVRAKTVETILDKYGVKNVMHAEDVKNKMLNSKAANGTFNTSEPEEILHQRLVDIYGKDDVVRQYKSEEYPFACDFYIKSRHLYVELNASWTHGGHWYNQMDESDVETVAAWQSKHTKYYDNAVKVWTKNDVKKRQVGIRNGLNYIVFWDNDLQDFNLWLSQGCPDGNDAVNMYSWLK